MYQVGQAVIHAAGTLLFVTENYDIHYGYRCVTMEGESHQVEAIKRTATEAEILAEAVKHGWVQTNSKWLYTSPSGQLELIDNDGWTPVIKRQPLSDQFGFFGQECITAHRLITALNLAK